MSTIVIIYFGRVFGMVTSFVTTTGYGNNSWVVDEKGICYNLSNSCYVVCPD